MRNYITYSKKYKISTCLRKQETLRNLLRTVKGEKENQTPCKNSSRQQKRNCNYLLQSQTTSISGSFFSFCNTSRRKMKFYMQRCKQENIKSKEELALEYLNTCTSDSKGFLLYSIAEQTFKQGSKKMDDT